jgi:acyl-CoA dehydrogenase
MQGLGSGPITLAGSPAQKARWLPAVAKGKAIAAFALSEPEAGSDVGAMTTTARRDGDSWVIDGTKTWISNGGIADFYCVFARAGGTAGANGISAFIVPAHASGLAIGERIEVIAPHPLARIVFDGCRVPADSLIGVPGEGFKIALRTLDVFRASVAAAALGFARRALDEALRHAGIRQMFGTTLGNLQLTQAKFGEMATEIDAAALLTYRAAWRRDVHGARATREAAMAKMAATESAQRVVDAAVQLFGGRGVRRGEVVERLYREIRALRIYEGATEVQKLVIARELVSEFAGSAG